MESKFSTPDQHTVRIGIIPWLSEPLNPILLVHSFGCNDDCLSHVSFLECKTDSFLHPQPFLPSINVLGLHRDLLSETETSGKLLNILVMALSEFSYFTKDDMWRKRRIPIGLPSQLVICLHWSIRAVLASQNFSFSTTNALVLDSKTALPDGVLQSSLSLHGHMTLRAKQLNASVTP